MSTRYIKADEWYPVYSLTPDRSFTARAEITDHELNWIKSTTEEFDKVQTFLAKKFEESKARGEV